MSSMAPSESILTHACIPCPHCGQPSTRIKSLRTGVLLFLGIGAFWRTWTEIGCPACVRSKLLGYTALNLLTPHILWPIAILPWMTVQLLRTALEGHSPKILTQLGLPVPPSLPVWVQFQRQLPIVFRVLGVVQLLFGALMMAGIAFVVDDTWLRFRIDVLIGEVLVAVVGISAVYLVYSGSSKVIGLAPHIWNRVGVAVLFGAVFPLATLSILPLATSRQIPAESYAPSIAAEGVSVDPASSPTPSIPAEVAPIVPPSPPAVPLNPLDKTILDHLH